MFLSKTCLEGSERVQIYQRSRHVGLAKSLPGVSSVVDKRSQLRGLERDNSEQKKKKKKEENRTEQNRWIFRDVIVYILLH